MVTTERHTGQVSEWSGRFARRDGGLVIQDTRSFGDHDLFLEGCHLMNSWLECANGRLLIVTGSRDTNGSNSNG
jgi:hypothetical protein